MTWFLTFHTYGTYFDGSEGLRTWRRRAMAGDPFVLGETERAVVGASFLDTCTRKGWTLLAFHVRTNHAHLVVSGAGGALMAIRDFKIGATLRLRERGLGRGRLWAGHGSYRKLESDGAVRQVVRYVLDGQGEKMETSGE